MAKYYLRMEGVNLYSFVYDANDLSTVRGGGLMLLGAPRIVEQALEQGPHGVAGVKKIVSGASVGLFEFDIDADTPAREAEIAADVRNDAARLLASSAGVPDATFVVDVGKKEGDFGTCMQKLLAKNRWRQFRQPTIAAPAKNESAQVTQPCELEGRRPGTVVRREGNEKKIYCESVDRRREYGRDKKRKFYTDELGDVLRRAFSGDFTRSFEELSKDETQGDLSRKMAVIYLDGNGFGKVRDDECREAEDLIEFESRVKKCRAKALADLIDRMDCESANGFKTETGAYRLETLLWGGDELIWVVPAWKGWEVLQAFYTVSMDKEWSFRGRRLTHAGGLVFCHHNAPIHKIVELSVSLAEATKEECRDKNLFQYLVLESFDHIGQDLGEFRKRHVPFKWRASLDGDAMEEAADAVRFARDRFPRGQIYKAVHAAAASARNAKRGENADCEENAVERFRKRLEEIVPKETLELLDERQRLKHLGDRNSTWLHLAQLWDYIPDKEART